MTRRRGAAGYGLCCPAQSVMSNTASHARPSAFKRCCAGCESHLRRFVRVVDALPVIRSSRFDLPLTYDAGALELLVGDVVRVSLGSRQVVAFVVSAVRDAQPKHPENGRAH